ncbi:caspase family protein [Streptomyces sp. NPDC090306]|uniref:HD domain-containing protein n=1 Tax=Streptomyces sp. NPDC090306 TaxID=3365961 RepID=UPI0037F8266E
MEREHDGERDTGRRRALLIGVTRTPYLEEHPDLAERYPRLDFADTDVALVREALKQSDYLVEPPCENTGYNPVLGRVSRFFESCAPGDTAFLYVSCHGVTLNGRDHLVLSDSQPGQRLPDGSRGLLPGSLMRADASELLSALPPGVTAVVCLDTCRTTEADRDTDPEHLLVPGGREAFLLYSCGPGQRAFADAAEGSWFARALARALSRSTPPRTFHEVVGHTNDVLRELAQRHPGIAPPRALEQTPLPTQGAALPRDPVVCAGSRQTLEWSLTLRDSVLWQHTSGTTQVHERIKDELEKLVHVVVESCLGAGAHRADPWSDPLYPLRVEARLGDLVERAALSGDELLSPAETACLLAAPVVHEGAVATALEDLRAALPKQFDPGPRGREADSEHDHRTLVRDAARDVCRGHGLVLRTTETLQRRGLAEAASAADHWLRHRFVADWDPLWERDSVYTSVHDLIDMAVGAIEAAAPSPEAGPRTEGARLEIDRRVRQVLGHLTVKPGASPRINDTGHTDSWDDGRDWRPVRGNRWRGPQLARLLWTAGLLAADPRRLSSVLVDHLGAREPLRPAAVVESLGAALDYDEDAGRTAETFGLAVRFDCPHPALHAALEELAGAADATVTAFRQDVAAQPLLRGLPDRVTTGQLRSLAGRYTEPLERFRLAEDEIRPLLMGTQLYGDRMLAVREMYQNAMDACRIRDMRRQYDGKAPWPGTITFTQGMDGRRPYIQCADDGSGMSRAKLTSMFARAGRRYEQDPEFVLERRNWRRAKLPERPMNSRFGIGVFSYFMLADEVVVWTTPVDQRGRTGDQRLRADIQSGSGLLRISPTRDPEAPDEGGTVVRLYLAEPRENEKRPSLLETLRSLLWVTEQHVRAVELGEEGQAPREHTWTPDTLEARPEWHGVPMRVDDDAWLVQGKGQILLDGVVVRDAPDMYGRVVNLRERHSPVPSVDRNQILEYDEAAVLKETIDGTAAAVAGCAEVSLPWLWQLALKAPRVAVAVLDALPAETVAVLGGGDQQRLGRERSRLRDIGCLPCDRNVMDNFYGGITLDDDRPSESELLENWQFTRLGVRQHHEAFAPDSYPKASGLDALLFRDDVPRLWASVIQTAAHAQVSVRQALTALRRYAVAGVAVPEYENVRLLGGIRPTKAAADLYSAYTAIAERSRCLVEGTYGPYRRYPSRGDSWSAVRPPARHAPLVLTSAVHELTLGEAARLLTELLVVDPSLPAAPDLNAALSAERLTRSDASVLCTEANTKEVSWADATGWKPGRLLPVDLLSRVTSRTQLAELVKLVENLSPLGFSVARHPTDEALETDGLPVDQRLLLSRSCDRTPPWREGEVSLREAVIIAGELRLRLGEVARRINLATAVTGITAPRIPDDVAEWPVPEWLASEAFHMRGEDQPTSPLTPWEFVGRYLQSGTSPEEVPEALRALAGCGLIEWRGTDAESLVRQTANVPRLLTPAPVERGLFTRPYASFSGELDRNGADLAYIVALAAAEKSTLGAVADDLREAETAIPLTVAEVPSGARRIRPTEADVTVLGESMTDGPITAFRDRLTVSDLVGHAYLSQCTVAASVDRLTAFTVLGAPAPPAPDDPDGPDFVALAEFVPTRFDRAALGKGLLGGSNTLGPLELVLLAGRFGTSVGKIYRRYAALRCLGLAVTVDAPDAAEAELLPDWRDVVILSDRLTGRAPALAGDVTADDITLRAEETDLDEAGVHARLACWARLFRLRLPARTTVPDSAEESP